jgi:xylan 1,4-beta-xylosidase
MKTVLSFLMLIFVYMLPFSACKGQESGSEPDRSIYVADPTIFVHEGVFYLYGTKSGNMDSSSVGFPVYTSTNLVDWTRAVGPNDGLALIKGDAFGERGFWAPQIFPYNGKFYMAYTANESIAFAVSDAPLGPFKNPQMLPITAPVRMIDPFVFFDDGKIYLYHVRVHQGNRLFVAEMNPDLLSIKPETLVECITAEGSWEDTANASWKVVEGPTVIKRNGLYYMVYSANHFRNPDYAVGYAVSDSPYGPWRKSPDSPIIHGSMFNESGTGHGDVFFDEQGNMFYVFHTHLSKTEISPRKSAIVELEFVKDNDLDYDKIIVKDGSFRFVKKAR